MQSCQRWNWLWILGVLVAGFQPSWIVIAQDANKTSDEDAALFVDANISRIWIASGGPTNQSKWNPAEATLLEALIIEVTEDGIRYAKKEDRQQRELKGDQIIAMEVAWANESAAEANRLYRVGEHRKSIIETTKTRSTKLLPWQQRALMANNIDSLRCLGMMEKSGDEFLRFTKYKPSILHFGVIPLLWTNEELDRRAVESAERWIKETEEFPRLLGASWLLGGKGRAESLQVLESLSKSKSSVVRQLAATQVWRTVPAGEVASRLYPKWSGARDSMPLPLQLGPTILLADKLDQAGSPQLAIPEWLRIASLHADRYDATKLAIQKATEALKKLGRAEEAEKINAQFQAKNR